MVGRRPDPPDQTEEWRPARPWLTWEIYALVAIVVLAGLLRFHEATLAPTLLENQDPLQFAWAGLTLITKHVPYSWEFGHVYTPDFILHTPGQDLPIVHPWLHHPPLFSLLVGGWVYLMGARELTDVTAEMVRPVAIMLGLVSLALAYVLGRRVLGRPSAIAGTLLLAVSPGAALLGRDVETEALLAPLLLTALILVHRLHSGEGGNAARAGLLLCCLLMPLTKVTGVVIAGGITVVLIASGRWRLAAGVLAAGAAGFGLYAVYAALFDFRLWLAVMAEWQTHRRGIMAGFEFITDSTGIGRVFRDGWWQLGWIALGAMVIRGRSGPRPMLLATTCIVYAAGLAAIGDVDVQARYGWYRIVLYPLIYLAAGYLAWQSVRRPSLPGVLLVLVLGGATATIMVTGAPWNPNAYMLAGIVGAALIPAVIRLRRPESQQWLRVAQVTTGGLLLTVVLTSIIESWNLARIYTQI